jgi:hypothetical protein
MRNHLTMSLSCFTKSKISMVQPSEELLSSVNSFSSRKPKQCRNQKKKITKKLAKKTKKRYKFDDQTGTNLTNFDDEFLTLPVVNSECSDLPEDHPTANPDCFRGFSFDMTDYEHQKTQKVF